MKKKEFAILGLGSFGWAVAKAIIGRKQKVTVFDDNEKNIANFQALYPSANAILADITNPNFVDDQALENYDGVILAVANHLEVGLLSAVMIKNNNIKSFIVRAKDNMHAEILKKIGINNIILPEQKISEIVASQMLYGIDSSVQILDDDFGIVDLVVDNEELINKTLTELNLLNNKDFNLVHIRRGNKIKLPAEITNLMENDKLVIITKLNKINLLEKRFNK